MSGTHRLTPPKILSSKIFLNNFTVFSSNTELMIIDLESTAPHSSSLINCGRLSQSIIVVLCLCRKDSRAVDKRPGPAWFLWLFAMKSLLFKLSVNQREQSHPCKSLTPRYARI